MGWSEDRQETFSQRGKEEAHDYRYFPEPDLPPLDINSALVDEIRVSLPELPDSKIVRYQGKLGLSNYDARILTEERLVAEWFEAAIDHGGDPRQISNWMINTLFGLMNENDLSIAQVAVKPAGLVELIALVEEGTINNNMAKNLLAEMLVTGQSPSDIVNERGLAQISDEFQLSEIILSILEENPEQVDRYLAGKKSLHGWFMGQVMRATGGKANPALVDQILSEQLSLAASR